MRMKRTLAVIVGITQSAIGIAAVILAFLLYSDLYGFRAMLDVSNELLPLNLLILSVFGFFSLISGFLLFYKG